LKVVNAARTADASGQLLALTRSTRHRWSMRTARAGSQSATRRRCTVAAGPALKRLENLLGRVLGASRVDDPVGHHDRARKHHRDERLKVVPLEGGDAGCQGATTTGQ